MKRILLFRFVIVLALSSCSFLL
ncbi:MAG: lipoprotein [Candidatus Cloacimonas sp.]|nr:lipoprotein [Candidatus Cloacimonas sp.]